MTDDEVILFWPVGGGILGAALLALLIAILCVRCSERRDCEMRGGQFIDEMCLKVEHAR